MTVRPEALDAPWKLRTSPKSPAGARGPWSLRRSWSQIRKGRFEFAIGLYEGPSPTELQPLHRISNPVLSRWDIADRRAAFVADPFMLRVSERWYMFFEVLNQDSEHGEIGLATSRDAWEWRYEGIVLSERFHLSYPHTFAWNGTYYMMPECYQAGGARLYEAVDFPYRWKYVAMLLEHPVLVDATVFQHEDRCWMFAETSPTHRQNCLRLFHSRDLLGPWQEHPESPVVDGDSSRCRPAGKVVRHGDSLIRFAQNCRPEYGTAVRAFEIVELTPERYRERELTDGPILGPGTEKWNRLGMHHVDAHEVSPGRWIACVDGR